MWSSLPAAAIQRRSLATGHWPETLSRLNVNTIWGDIVVVLPRFELAAVAYADAHASAKSYTQAAKKSGRAAARAERTKRTQFRKDVPDHHDAAFWVVPLTLKRHSGAAQVTSALETCGYIGKGAMWFVNRLGDIAAKSGRILKRAFVRWAMQLLSLTVPRGNSEMYRRSGLVISCERGLRYDAGVAVPVLMS